MLWREEWDVLLMDALEIAVEKEYVSYDFYKRAAVLAGEEDSKTCSVNWLKMSEITPILY